MIEKAGNLSLTERRDFFKVLFVGVAAGLGFRILRGNGVAGARDPAAVPAIDPALAKANTVLRMQEELARALRKPTDQRSWGMVIDTRKCIGCNACTVACIAENVLPPGVSYRTVPEAESGEYPNVTRVFMPTNCQQCDEPPCVKAANALVPGAIAKRPDGIVAIDYTRFTGKEAFAKAAKACPYTALYYDDGRFYTEGTPKLEAYEQVPGVEYEKEWPRARGKPPVTSGRKCHFCLHRLAVGMLPACVTTCVGRAMHFGDLNDKGSLAAELLSKNPSMRINEAKGTKPRVYYLADSFTEGLKACAACHGN